MKNENIGNLHEQKTDVFIRICHLGMILFGVTAWLTGDAADDYKNITHVWFTRHGWVGMGLASSFLLYILYCTFGPVKSRFSSWVPFTKERLLKVMEDLKGLLRFRLPERASHEGFAGLVQLFGILVFTGMAVTGALMFFLLEPGGRAVGLVHDIKEVHEAGEILIPVYLSLHVGAVLLHSITGRPVWRRIFFFKEKASVIDLKIKRGFNESAAE
ncbi:MAG: cytochrome b/b6 domain-containing protein [Nitrospirota bacterium]